MKGYGTKGIALPGPKQLSSVVVGLDGQWQGARFAAACRGVGAGRIAASSVEAQGKYGVSMELSALCNLAGLAARCLGSGFGIVNPPQKLTSILTCRYLCKLQDPLASSQNF